MLKIVIGTNEGKVLCISNNEDKIKASMVNYLIDTDQEPTEDFFESRNWGEYDIEVYDYHQPQLNENQQIAINNAKKSFEKGADLYDCAIDMMLYDSLTDKEWAKATVAFLLWAQEQEEE